MSVRDLPTPCVLVDAAVVENNCQRMSQHISALGGRLRPHVKTHKCAEVARLQTHGHFGGITVSTLAEARFFFEAGFQDITYAVPLAPGRAPEVLDLGRRGLTLGVLVDSSEPVDALVSAHETGDRPVPTFLKLDCGYGRAGVAPDDPRGLQLAGRIHHDPALDFRGILAHAGHSYDADSVDAVRQIAATERAVTVAYAESLEASGIPCPERSIGSTPTCVHGTDLTGVTEVRPGNYAFFDLVQHRLGSCSMEDIAITVLTTVIGRHDDRELLVIDAGALALSKDPGANHLHPQDGFGRVCGLDGSPLPGLRLASLSQEHGLVRSLGGPLPSGLGVGDKLRILPNHSCLTAACHSGYHVVGRGDGDTLWHRAQGW